MTGGSIISRRELVVLECLTTDASIGEIAASLWVSRNTVKSQIRGVYAKLGVNDRASAVSRARELGLLDAQPAQTSTR